MNKWAGRGLLSFEGAANIPGLLQLNSYPAEGSEMTWGATLMVGDVDVPPAGSEVGLALAGTRCRARVESIRADRRPGSARKVVVLVGLGPLPSVGLVTEGASRS